jgi:nicotinamidase-related amidase
MGQIDTARKDPAFRESPDPEAHMREPACVLHDWRIEPREYARHEARRGRRHAFAQLDPRRTALVVVDMVPFFLEANPYARGIVPNIRALATALRSAGGTVAWVLPGTAPFSPATNEFYGPDVAETYRNSGGTGPLPDRLAPGLGPSAEDLFVEKTAASAFSPGQCALDERLRQRDVQTVLVTGTVANVCCESTTRDASTLGYRVIMVADANAARRDEDLNATLHTIYRSFGDVRPTSEVLDMIHTARDPQGDGTVPSPP